MSDPHSSSVDLEAEVQRLRKRTHEIQEAADKRCALLSKTVEYWRSSLALDDSYLEESGVVFHSSVTRAKAASLFQQIATLQAQLAAQTAVVAEVKARLWPERDFASHFSELCEHQIAVNDALGILARLDAADVPAARTTREES